METKTRFFKISITFFLLFYALPSIAQVIPDTTLPVNSNALNDDNTTTITGGTQAGANLFHSFAQFSVLTGSSAYFNNALDIQNIISRVTGTSVSNIDGKLQANGTANLFLINPNGIVFGRNASLNIGGSFLASTASSLNFANDTQFSATAPQSTPLLSVNVPIGLQFGNNPGKIHVQDTGHNLINLGGFFPITKGDTSTSLEVYSGKTLALVGGDLALEGGILTAPEGRIKLGSVDSGSVSLTSTSSGWSLGYENVPNFKDVQLSQEALVDVSGASSGSIHIQGGRVSLVDGSVVLNQNQGLQPSGSISVNASKLLNLVGISSKMKTASSLITETLATGLGGNITVSTKDLVVQDGGQILTSSFSSAKGGDLTIDVSNSIQLLNFSSLDPKFYSNIATGTFDSGNGGNITLNAQSFTAKNGGSLGSAALGTGTGGNVTVSANFVELKGVEPTFFSASAVTALAFSSGNSGTLTINTPSLVLQDGGKVTTSTSASGKAGNLTINADSIAVSGTVPGSVSPSLIDSSANILDSSLQQIFRLPPTPSGDAGNLTINTGATAK
jgi:filamentous hemagglutinin family protein